MTSKAIASHHIQSMDYSSSGKITKALDLNMATGILCRKIPTSGTKNHRKADTAERCREVEDGKAAVLDMIDAVGTSDAGIYSLLYRTRISVWSLFADVLEHRVEPVTDGARLRSALSKRIGRSCCSGNWIFRFRSV
jgi:hypothetical protein